MLVLAREGKKEICAHLIPWFGFECWVFLLLKANTCMVYIWCTAPQNSTLRIYSGTWAPARLHSWLKDFEGQDFFVFAKGTQFNRMNDTSLNPPGTFLTTRITLASLWWSSDELLRVAAWMTLEYAMLVLKMPISHGNHRLVVVQLNLCIA